MNRLAEVLARLGTLSPTDLRAEWRRDFGEDAPDLSPSLLRRALAYHAQEQVGGGLSAVTLRMLGVAGARGGQHEAEIRLKPGTRLLREWNGKVHSVLITDEGLLMGDRHFASLSQVAKEITGAHWSGPRFFGLKRRAAPPLRGSAAHG